jgi:nucleoside-diphosphate-sugar epimerase
MTGEMNVILGAGPVGRAIARALLAEGEPVRLVSRAGTAQGLAGAEPWRADLSDPGAAREACAGASRIFHAAAPPYHRWLVDFPALQENIIAAAAGTGAVLVVVENLYGYGVAGQLHEALPAAATTRKGRLRAEMSARVFAAHESGKVRAVVGRASDFFGPEVRAAALGERFFPPLLAGRTLAWPGDPDAPHSHTYVPDFAAALIRLGRIPTAWGRAWHVPSPRARSARDIAEEAAEVLGLPAPKIRRMPRTLLRIAGIFDRGAAEMVEMTYQFEAPFEILYRDFDAAFGVAPTGWTAALAETTRWWQRQSG